MVGKSLPCTCPVRGGFTSEHRCDHSSGSRTLEQSIRRGGVVTRTASVSNQPRVANMVATTPTNSDPANRPDFGEPIERQAVASDHHPGVEWELPLPPNPFHHCEHVQCQFLGQEHRCSVHCDARASRSSGAATEASEDGPTLEDSSASTPPSVPRLSHLVLLPCTTGGHGADSCEFLRSVKSISIRQVRRCADGTWLYSVETSRVHRTSRIPISHDVLDCVSTAEDLQVQRRHSQFVALRQALTSLLCLNARFVCPLCREFSKLVTLHPAQPWVLALLGARSSLRVRILESFLQQSVRAACTLLDHKRDCRLCRGLPLILREFLSEMST
jgi:hypothetical protein